MNGNLFNYSLLNFIANNDFICINESIGLMNGVNWPHLWVILNGFVLFSIVIVGVTIHYFYVICTNCKNTRSLWFFSVGMGAAKLGKGFNRIIRMNWEKFISLGYVSQESGLLLNPVAQPNTEIDVNVYNSNWYIMYFKNPMQRIFAFHIIAVVLSIYVIYVIMVPLMVANIITFKCYTISTFFSTFFSVRFIN